MAANNQHQSRDKNQHNDGRGFAGMDPERQREIASMGGKAAHESGNAHEWDSEEAREAGRKGGEAAHASGNAHEWDSEEAREAGRKGGQAAHANGNAHEFDSKEAREAGRKGGAASHKGDGNDNRGGSSEQHAEAGRQSHKNTRH